MSSQNILVLNGPNLNLLGTREPEIYGATTLADIETMCRAEAAKSGAEIDFRQSNSEVELIEWIQGARTGFDGLVINAAAYTHTSVAIHDALKMLDIPVVEVHITNPHAREPFRHTSYISPIAKAVIAGCGARGYVFALQYLLNSSIQSGNV